MAETAEVKLDLAGQWVKMVTAAGIPIANLLFNPLLYPLSADTKSTSATLEAAEQIMKEFPGVRTIFG